MKIIIFLLTALVVVSASPVHAVTTGVDFLKLGIGARETGMGEASAAVYSGVTSSFWNPAGLAETKTMEVGFMHSEAIVDATLNFIGAAFPVRDQGVFALNTIIYIIKPVPVTNASGQSLGDLNWLDSAFTLSYARKITKDIACGLSGKIIHRAESDPIFGKSEGNAFAVDAGVIYTTPVPGLNAGYTLLNSGTELQMTGEVKKDTLPQTSRLGISYDYKLDKSITMLSALDFHRILDSSWHVGGGVELNINSFFFIRTGFYEKDGNISGNTFGFGFQFNQFKFDYSSIPVSEMAGFNRNNKFSLSVYF